MTFTIRSTPSTEWFGCEQATESLNPKHSNKPNHQQHGSLLASKYFFPVTITYGERNKALIPIILRFENKFFIFISPNYLSILPRPQIHQYNALCSPTNPARYFLLSNFWWDLKNMSNILLHANHLTYPEKCFDILQYAQHFQDKTQ